MPISNRVRWTQTCPYRSASPSPTTHPRWRGCAGTTRRRTGHPTQPFAAFAEGCVEFVRSALASGRWAIWVAESDGRMVAHIYVQVVEKVPRPGRDAARWGYTTAVYAAPGARDKGIDSLLLRRVIDWAKEQELELLLLWPSDRSVPFYERAGFAHSPDALELHLDS
jgi:GNAT superfamily N-acetyltransferase